MHDQFLVLCPQAVVFEGIACLTCRYLPGTATLALNPLCDCPATLARCVTQPSSLAGDPLHGSLPAHISCSIGSVSFHCQPMRTQYWHEHGPVKYWVKLFPVTAAVVLQNQDRHHTVNLGWLHEVARTTGHYYIVSLATQGPHLQLL